MVEFKRYRKITPTIARTLTEIDYRLKGGVIHTNEGMKSFLPGDALARDAKGEWPIKIETIRASYFRTGEVDPDGWSVYLPLDVLEARQMPEMFGVDGLNGKPGDYLVRSGDRQWIVDKDIFESSYAEV